MRVDVLSSGLSLRAFLSLLLKHLLLSGRDAGLTEILQEGGEGRRRKEHASKISQSVVLLTKLLVLVTETIRFLGLDSKISFELTNVFCDLLVTVLIVIYR